ncbi:MAG: 2-oxoacid:acceptor oxidoreductase subunit alpha, partial [Bdellovibrionales bacterium]
HDPKAAYCRRGTGHDESSKYTESPEVFFMFMERLVRKLETSREMVPQPEVHDSNSAIGLIYYGSSSQIIPELENLLDEKGVKMAKLRIRALPLSRPVKDFVAKYDSVIVMEQNRDGQMKDFICAEYFDVAHKIKSVRCYDGLPIQAEKMSQKILEVL